LALPPLQDALNEAGLLPICTYISRRVHTIRKYIETRPIYQLCLMASNAARDDRCLWWWTQSVDPPSEDDDHDATNDTDNDESP
jgi:predicted esterase YcpF (UPF0227 family)